MRSAVLGALVLFLSLPRATLGSTVNVGTWYEFSFTEVGVEALGCYPADPSPTALNCFPSYPLVSVFAPEPTWTFTLSQDANLVVTDAFLHGDSFDVFNNGSYLFSTPSVPTDGLGCGDNPEVCLGDPNASHGSFALGPGSYSISIVPNATADAGAAYFEVVPVPEPNLAPALFVVLAAFAVCVLPRRPFRKTD